MCDNYVTMIIRLYKSLEEYDVLNGVFTNLDETHDVTHRALLAEERSDYVTASQLYKEVTTIRHCLSIIDMIPGTRERLGRQSTITRRRGSMGWLLIDGTIIVSYSELTRWEELSDTVDACIV